MGAGNKILAFKILSAKRATQGQPRHCHLPSSYAADQRNNKVYTCINSQMNCALSENVNFSTTVLLCIGQLVAIMQFSCHFGSGLFSSTVLQLLHCHILIYRITCAKTTGNFMKHFTYFKPLRL